MENPHGHSEDGGGRHPPKPRHAQKPNPGVVAPDRHPERELQVRMGRGGRVYVREGYVSHHGDTHKLAVRHMWAARRLWLQGRSCEAAYQLGCALHYLQNRYIGKRFLESFEEAEARLAESRVPSATVEEVLEASRCSAAFAEAVVYAAKPVKGNRALLEAAAASASLASAVLGPRTPPPDLEDAYLYARKRHLRNSVLAAVSAAAVFAALFTIPLAAVAIAVH